MPTLNPWPWALEPPSPVQPHLRATLRDLGPWYLVLTASAFSRKRSDRSYSITPCSTSPMLFWVQSGRPWSALPALGRKPVPLSLPSTHVQQSHLRVVFPEHEQCEVAGTVQQAQGCGELAAGKAVEGQVHLWGHTGQARAAAGPPLLPLCTPCPQWLLTYSWMVLGCSMPITRSLISTAFCWLLRAWESGGLSSQGGYHLTPSLPGP